MKQLLKKIIKATPLYIPLCNYYVQMRNYYVQKRWKRNGTVPPTYIVKQQVIRSFAEKFGSKIMIETGTYYGDMVEAMKGNFNQIYSIELSEELYKRAKKRFNTDENVKIIHGDSGVELGKLLSRIKPKQPILFWLDGHCSGDGLAGGDTGTPIYKELTHIFNANLSKYVIIIDDARCFGYELSYPSIKELSDFIKTKRPNSHIEIKDDSIRVTPSKVDG